MNRGTAAPAMRAKSPGSAAAPRRIAAVPADIAEDFTSLVDGMFWDRATKMPALDRVAQQAFAKRGAYLEALSRVVAAHPSFLATATEHAATAKPSTISALLEAALVSGFHMPQKVAIPAGKRAPAEYLSLCSDMYDRCSIFLLQSGQGMQRAFLTAWSNRLDGLTGAERDELLKNFRSVIERIDHSRKSDLLTISKEKQFKGTAIAEVVAAAAARSRAVLSTASFSLPAGGPRRKTTPQRGRL